MDIGEWGPDQSLLRLSKSKAPVFMLVTYAAQGDGEIAGHTMDVSGSVTCTELKYWLFCD